MIYPSDDRWLPPYPPLPPKPPERNSWARYFAVALDWGEPPTRRMFSEDFLQDARREGKKILILSSNNHSLHGITSDITGIFLLHQHQHRGRSSALNASFYLTQEISVNQAIHYGIRLPRSQIKLGRPVTSSLFIRPDTNPVGMRDSELVKENRLASYWMLYNTAEYCLRLIQHGALTQHLLLPNSSRLEFDRNPYWRRSRDINEFVYQNSREPWRPRLGRILGGSRLAVTRRQNTSADLLSFPPDYPPTQLAEYFDKCTIRKAG